MEGETGSLMAELDNLRLEGQKKVEMINQFEIKTAKM